MATVGDGVSSCGSTNMRRADHLLPLPIPLLPPPGSRQAPPRPAPRLREAAMPPGAPDQAPPRLAFPDLQPREQPRRRRRQRVRRPRAPRRRRCLLIRHAKSGRRFHEAFWYSAKHQTQTLGHPFKFVAWKDAQIAKLIEK